jgi:hypothetical protein
MWLDFRQVRTIFKKFSSAMGMLVVGGEERKVSVRSGEEYSFGQSEWKIWFYFSRSWKSRVGQWHNGNLKPVFHQE